MNKNINRKNSFMFRKNLYGIGTIVKIMPNKKEFGRYKGKNMKVVSCFVDNNGSLWFNLESVSSDGVNGTFVACGDPNNWVESIVEPSYCCQKFYKKDKEIDDMFHGWSWYIIIMAVGIFCTCKLAIWIGATIAFFSWRGKQLVK